MNHMVYFDYVLNTNACPHYLTTYLCRLTAYFDAQTDCKAYQLLTQADKK